MIGWSYIALAVLILLLLPAVVLPWEGRRVPDAVYVALACGGLVVAGLEGGLDAITVAVVGAMAIVLVVTGIVTAIRVRHRVQVLTAGHIKLLGSGALWLGPFGALTMAIAALALLVLAALLQRFRSRAGRPDFAAIAALAILCASIPQSINDPTPPVPPPGRAAG